MKKPVLLALLCFSLLQAWAQSREIRGKITDKTSRQGLRDVTIAIKGTTKAVVTDAEGNFSIIAPSAAPVELEITLVGYGTQIIQEKGNSPLSITMFDETNDARYDASFQTVWYVNKAATGFAIGDTAAYTAKKTIPAAEMNGKKYTTYDLSKVYGTNGAPIQRRFYVSLKKFKDSTRASFNEAQSARDAFVMRLAEMYMIAAESEFKIGKLDSAAYYLNIVRTRAALPGRVANMQVLPTQVTLDFILDERAREFAGEQLRWFDLKRTGKLVERVKAMNPDATSFIQPFHAVRPIPQTQIDAVTNKDEFKQNPGYQ